MEEQEDSQPSTRLSCSGHKATFHMHCKRRDIMSHLGAHGTICPFPVPSGGVRFGRFSELLEREAEVSQSTERMYRVGLLYILFSERIRTMILGMTTATYTLIHVLISLVGIVSGLVVVFGLLRGKRLDGWTALFLATTVATSVTGFGFPFDHLLPSHKVGILSLVLLAIAILARYAFHLAGSWRVVYVISAVVALYLNVFVGVVQAFEKVQALKALAPTQKEPPFLVAQLVVLVIFIALTILAAIKFRNQPLRAA